ncbi:MAG: hypothetical protein ACREYF_20520 [Gammaproteobacteria bacterium]
MRLLRRPVVHLVEAASTGEDAMEFTPISSLAHIAKVLLVAGLLGFGSVVGAQTGEPSSGVERPPFTSQTIPNDPERSLTADCSNHGPGYPWLRDVARFAVLRMHK